MRRKERKEKEVKRTAGGEKGDMMKQKCMEEKRKERLGITGKTKERRESGGRRK